MHRINVMFSSRPKLLSEVIRNLIERQPDMTVIGEVIDPIELIFALRIHHADIVIITPLKSNGVPKICSQLLKEHPLLKILAIPVDSKAFSIYQSNAPRIEIENPSEQSIVDAIRKALV